MPRKGRWTWLYDVKSVISASRPPRIRVIQPWISKNQTLPTPSHRRSVNSTPVPPGGGACPRGRKRSPPERLSKGRRPQPPQLPHPRPASLVAIRRWRGSCLGSGRQTLEPAFVHGKSMRKEVIHTHAGLAKDGPEGSFRQVTWVIGDGGVALARRLVPDLVGACGLAIESKPTALQTLHHTSW